MNDKSGSFQLAEWELSVLQTNPLFMGLDQDHLLMQLKIMKAEKMHSVRAYVWMILRAIG